jgi:sialate O-acetylesterase
MRRLNVICIAFLLLWLIIFNCNYAVARVFLPALISDNMLIQRNTDVKLWGKAAVNVNVVIYTSWNKSRYTVRSDKNGEWVVKVPTGKGGGPFEISFDDGEKLTISNILIGEVWVCSGQSNMEMAVKGWKLNQPVTNSVNLLLDAENDQVRLFKVDKLASDSMRKDCKGAWVSSTASAVYDFSAIGYIYARLLQSQLKVPVGIIQAANGGTKIEAWMSKSSLLPFYPAIEGLSRQELSRDHSHSTLLFNGLINPLLDFTIKGVIWYQGESNRLEPANYNKLFPAMVKDWRQRWGLGDFPFYYVQIAPYSYPREEIYSARTALMRDIQRDVMKIIPNSGVVVALDAGDSVTIHPPDKEIISKRLVLWALANTYHRKGLPYRSPEFREQIIKLNKVLLKFDFAPNGLSPIGNMISDFEIAGDNKVFHPATAVITTEGIEVTSDKVDKPVAVRYAYKAWVRGGLYSTDGLPLSSFRTDNWDIP